MDEDGECVSRSDGDGGLVHLPMDVATEVRKATEKDQDEEPR